MVQRTAEYKEIERNRYNRKFKEIKLQESKRSRIEVILKLNFFLIVSLGKRKEHTFKPRDPFSIFSNPTARTQSAIPKSNEWVDKDTVL